MNSDINLTENTKITIDIFRLKRKIFILYVIMLYGDIRGRDLSFLTSELHASATSNPAKVPRYARNKSLGDSQMV